MFIWGEAEKEGERESPKQAPWCPSQGGLDLSNHEIMTWAKLKSQRLNPLSHPDAPKFTILKQHICNSLKIFNYNGEINIGVCHSPLNMENNLNRGIQGA